jgi:lysosomal alpha-glucosidase
MFGVVHVGADICGFRGATTEELCTRWTQLGAFYPFMRNHNGYETVSIFEHMSYVVTMFIKKQDQDPASFSWEAQQIMKQAVLMRYSLIPYWYTLYYEAATESKTVVQPLLFEY